MQFCFVYNYTELKREVFMVKEQEIRKAAKECIRTCFEEDTEVMLDESIFRIKSIMFYIYDLVYFGNKIIISKQTFEKMKLYKRMKHKRILSTNAEYLLEVIEKDTYGNYRIVDLSKENAGSSAEKLSNYLKKNKNIVYLLESQKYHQRLVELGVGEQLKLLKLRMKINSLIKSRTVEFVTIGAIQHIDGKMLLSNRPGDTTIFRAYDEFGKIKEGEVVEVKEGDIVLIRSEKKTKHSFIISQVVTRHSRHQAVSIIWTDIAKGHKTNFYVEKLEEKYKQIILQNVT